MREIKFRVYDPENKTMEDAGAIDWDSDGLPITVNTATKKLYRGGFKDDFILMQYTNHSVHDEDAEGSRVKLYEGDIIQDGSANKNKHVIVWDDFGSGFILEPAFDDEFYYSLGEALKAETFKKIGNIHENPELLTNQNPERKLNA